jgi:thiol-disulfide isomerase/thioredoxin
MKLYLLILFFISANICKSQIVFDKLPILQLPDSLGHLQALNQFENKLVLVDFWASWCRPCRRYNNPWVKNIYKKYHDKGLEIYSINLDADYGDWIDAIKKDSLQGVLVNDVYVWKGKSIVLFDVHSIPAKFLYFNGQLISANESMTETEEKIANILAK